jgi:hypothetical protein
MKRNRKSKFVALGWIFLGAILLGGSLYIAFIATMTDLHPDKTDQYVYSTAEITMIPAPTLTPLVIFPTSSEPTATTTSKPPVQTGGIGIGVYVKITGTNGEGLNLRTSPGTSSSIRFLGMDSEVFLVKDGPQQADNFIWWYLQAPYDSSRNGWAAANYLTVIQNPTPSP